MCKEKNKDKKNKQDSDDKTQILLRCNIHNISYPQGSKCPECEKEENG